MNLGPFKFAWADESETTFSPTTHNRYDEIIFSAVIEQSEANFATLTIEMVNPNVGLLSAGRKIWAWFAWDNGSELVPLFFGRLIGSPSNLLRKVITVKFIAQPADFLAQKHHLAQAMKIRPYYDPIFIDATKRDDPDAIIVGYSSLWHTDRVTHEVSASDVLVGEDGVENFAASEVVLDSVDIGYGQAPIPSASLELNVTWKNASSGFLDMGSGVRRTYTGGSLIADWPKEGASLGGGWSVHHSYAIDLNNIENVRTFNQKFKYENQEATHTFGDTMSVESDSNGPTGFRLTPQGEVPGLVIKLTDERQIEQISENPDFKDIQPAFTKITGIIVGIWDVGHNLVLRYDAGRSRVERCRIRLTADLQEIVTSVTGGTAGGGGDTPEVIDGCDIGQALVTNDFITGETISIEAAPIGDTSRTDYFAIERGNASIEYGISRLRAKILMASRGVEAAWDVTWERGINLSCRKNAALAFPGAPGGALAGKIISYSLIVNGDAGQQIGKVRVGCAIGRAGHATAVPGTGVYANPGYMNVGYQYLAGAIVPIGTSDVAYTPPVGATNDAGMTFPLTADQVVLVDEWIGDYTQQHVILVDKQPQLVMTANTDQATFQTILQEFASHTTAGTVLSDSLLNNGVYRHIVLKPVDAEGLEKIVEVATSVMTVPRMYDTEAA